MADRKDGLVRIEVRTDDDTVVHADDETQACKILAEAMESTRYGWFQASRMMQWNKPWIDGLKETWIARLEEICESRRDATDIYAKPKEIES